MPVPTLEHIRNKLGDASARFVDIELLGRGAEGGTWRAFDRGSERDVVLKFVPKQRVKHLTRAFRVLRHVASPHLPAARELLSTADGACLVTAYIPGNQLACSGVPVAQAIAEGVALTHALQAIHAAGTHHGDVSLANVIQTPDGELVLTDFGQLGCRGGGTPGFLAPEVLAGGGGPAADLFALGCVLFARLFGEVPWRDPAVVARLDPSQVELRLKKVAQTRKVDSSIAAVLTHLLDPDPQRRRLDVGVLLSRMLRIQQCLDKGQVSMDVPWWIPAKWPYRGVGVGEVVDTIAGGRPPGLVVVAGPAGSGRGRLVEELILALQSARAASSHSVDAVMCSVEHLPAILGASGGDWLTAWMHSSTGQRVIGVDGELLWSGELSGEGLEPAQCVAMRAAVLTGAARLARATLVVAVAEDLADALKRAGEDHSILFLHVQAWSSVQIAEVLGEVLGDNLDQDLRTRWIRAVAETTHGWPARVVRGLEASARTGLQTPDLAVLAACDQQPQLDEALAQAVVRGAWDGDEACLNRYPQARALLADSCQAWAREVLAERSPHSQPELCLILDADDLQAFARWTCVLAGNPEQAPGAENVVPPAALRERERQLLQGWLAAGGMARLDATTRARVAAFFLRQGEAAWVLEQIDVDSRKLGPQEQVLCVRALEQLGRAAEALDRAGELLGDRAREHKPWRNTLHGLRWRAMTDLGQGREVLALVRAWSDGGPHPATLGVAEAWLWGALAALLQGEDLLAEQWLVHARDSVEGVANSGPRARGLTARIAQLEGNLAHARGQFAAASACYRQAAEAFAAAGEPGGQVLLLANLAGLALISGDASYGVEAGRRALAGQVARGRMQALPAIVVNLVGLLIRVNAVDEAALQVRFLHGLLAARGDPGKVAHARLAFAQAEVAWAQARATATKPEQATLVAAATGFAEAARVLDQASCSRESVVAWLRAAAGFRQGLQTEQAHRAVERAHNIAVELDDQECELWLAFAELSQAVSRDDKELFIQYCQNLKLLPRPGELVRSGRLELAFAYDRAFVLALHHFLGPTHPRTRTVARRAHATLETLMNQVDPIDQKAVRAHHLHEADEPEVLTELLAEAERGASDASAAPRTGPTRRQSSRHERLIRIYRRLAREDELERLLVQVVDAMMELSDAERGVVVVTAPSAPAGERIEVARELAPGSDGVVFSRSIIDRVLEGGQPILSVDAAEDDRFDGSRSVSHLNLRSVLAVPLVFRGEVLGAAYVDHRLRRGAFDETDLSHIEEFAELAGLAVAHARTLAAQRKQADTLAAQGKELARLLEERENEVRGLREEMRDTKVAERKIYRGMVGGSPAMQEVFRLIDRLANSDISVVVYGESGTGKELVSRAIHDAGERRNKPFVAENCGAIPESLLESVLFGHARGAFTGAHRASAGLFEAANGGTIFLDEIGEMSPAMQTKLLRVLQEGVVRRVGETVPRKIDVRVIAASNRDLDQMVKDGSFRQDLFYRIQVVKIALPPLRMRTQDLAPLIAHFLARHDPKNELSVSAAAMRALARYPWPGNIRELENEVQRWGVLAQGRVEPADLSPHIQGHGGDTGPDPDDLRLKPRVERLERDLIAKALSRCGGNQTRAAELLGVSRYGLQKKIRRFENT